jgi:hypothetical protein
MRLILPLLLPAVLAAALVPAYSLEALVARSPRILEGKVADSWTAWDPPHKHIWTHYRVEVIEAFSGGRAGTVVSEPGGRAGNIEESYSNSVPYARGERVILFLFRTPIGYWRTTGGPQGKVVVGPRDEIRTSVSGLPPGGTGQVFRARLRRMAAANPVREAGRQ